MKKIVIMTAFNPSIEDCHNIERICEFSDVVVLVDNSPLNSANYFQFVSKKIKNITIISNFNIAGVSGAFNKARRLLNAYSDPSDNAYVMLLDQDTQISGDVMEAMFNALNNFIPGAALGAKFSDANHVSNVNDFRETTCLPSSTMTLRLNDFLAVNDYDVRFPVDLADFVWCWSSARSNGMKFYEARGIHVYQRLGVGSFKIGPYKLSYPSPKRHEYQFEATLRLWQVKGVPLRSLFRFNGSAIIKLFIYPIFLPNGKKRFFYMLKGIQKFFQPIS